MRDSGSTSKIRGFTQLNRLHLDGGADFEYDLLLELEDPHSGAKIEVRCAQVSNLRLSEFGGGLIQLLCLEIDDVSERQWEGVRYHLQELERDTFECHCREIIIERKEAG